MQTLEFTITSELALQLEYASHRLHSMNPPHPSHDIHIYICLLCSLCRSLNTKKSPATIQIKTKGLEDATNVGNSSSPAKDADTAKPTIGSQRADFCDYYEEGTVKRVRYRTSIRITSAWGFIMRTSQTRRLGLVRYLQKSREQ
ncbi:hypothetical protein KCU89_g61, partial [Aureobasidium melanogenum]